jgi:signal transduction histidine kinase
MDEHRLRALLDVGRSLIAELDTDAILARLLDVARELTGARYAAIGVLDEERTELERFLVAGIEEEARHAIGDLPRGRGVLGVLIDEPRPLRLSDVGAHPRSYGFPPGHPRMETFLGVPILIRGEAWGNLYLTEKDGEFSAADEESVVVLSEWAAIAIDNARLYRGVMERRDELERVNRRLETTIEVSRGLGGMTDLDQVLELVVKRSRALLDGRAAELALLDGDELEVAAVAGEDVDGVRGTRLRAEDSLAREALRDGRSHRYEEPRRAVVTPLRFRNRTVGVLMVFDRLDRDAPFTTDEARLLDAFAASAATAVATAQTARDEMLRRSIRASEEERRRWARELHDQTLQDMAGLSMLLSAARRSSDPADLADAVDRAVDLLSAGVAGLRALITDLRPAALDELGVEAALEGLVERAQASSGVRIDLSAHLAGGPRLDGDVESTIYRLVQEALTNVVKHAGASHAVVEVIDHGDTIDVEVRDDGRGIDLGHTSSGFGLVGMRERLALVRGTLDVSPRPGGGTALKARMPAQRRLSHSPNTGSSR